MNHNLIAKQFDMSKVRSVIYHLPDGQTMVLSVDDLDDYMEFGHGVVCDTSDIDGIVHYFPRGNA